MRKNCELSVQRTYLHFVEGDKQYTHQEDFLLLDLSSGTRITIGEHWPVSAGEYEITERSPTYMTCICSKKKLPSYDIIWRSYTLERSSIV